MRRKQKLVNVRNAEEEQKSRGAHELQRHFAGFTGNSARNNKAMGDGSTVDSVGVHMHDSIPSG